MLDFIDHPLLKYNTSKKMNMIITQSKTRAFKWDHNYTDRMNFLQGVYDRSSLNEDSVISKNWVPLTDKSVINWPPLSQKYSQVKQ